MFEDLNIATADVMESLSETEKPLKDNEFLLKMVSLSKLLHSLTVIGVSGCYHISCVTQDRIWVSDIGHNLILTNTNVETLHRIPDLNSDLYGLHTVDSESELIYIDKYYNIKKLLKDMKTTTTFIERKDYTWGPLCVHWTPSTEDLLVGMYNFRTETGKVTRYNQNGQLTQTIQHDNTGLELYNEPIYLAENNNGDVLVSDFAYDSDA